MKLIIMKLNAIATKVNLSVVLMALGVTFLTGCSEEVKDFGFTGQISGTILDQNGNPVAGDASNAELTVFLLGEEDRVPLELRVNNDGTFTNTELYPQSYTLTITGPIDAPAPQNVDLTVGAVQNDITVTPYIVVAEPSATISGSNISVSYSISPSTGHLVDEIKVLVSTVKKVGVNTGSGARWQTLEANPVDNSGTAVVALDTDFLEAVEKWGDGAITVRIAAKSDQTSAWNLSLPIVVDL
ncbi:carboxypeptidase regulatory-like domain-containing protein [Aurantibacter crassamenti]|uniref:carboxypeptidase-like regulatory domain-containing protein n=1 Tax=Aurantibacter crassamenti TaxID=1837375 RepID=UPI0019398183|nr:carboxypeptidase-like regulatory domain-containing protein [Aurantibacter crassamenti]MBM1105875.1 carboxypeptidase regulatory-like domain-containing protein [Aurantibacter crassamenti]